ncbi:MAG: hypothetical protein ACREOJ_11765 [Gemmatimonadaceae bacterium]
MAVSTPVTRSQASLSSKTQLTVSGGICYPAISPDGKQLAFAERHCTGADCLPRMSGLRSLCSR